MEGSDTRKHADAVFSRLILPAMTQCQIRYVVRSDQMRTPGRISDQMFRHILNSSLCVAVLTGHNPNVFYELAVAQARKRPVIVLMERGGSLPFDIADLRCIFYDLDNDVPIAQLAEFIEDIKAGGWRAPDIFAPFSDVSERQAALRRFCDRVTGEWWEHISVGDRFSLSYFRIGFDEVYNTVQLGGRVYANGRVEAHWNSSAAAVEDNKIVYVRKCWHPVKPDAAEYHGFGLFHFENGNSGWGRFVDVGGVARPVTFHRVTDEAEKSIMKANIAEDIHPLLEKVLRRF